MLITNIETSGICHAIRGMRNPMNSWNKSDSVSMFVGENDMALAQKLIKAGNEHCKFLRQIQVWADFELPRYIWSEMDTYKFMTKNSCSTMHKLLDKKHVLTIEDFEIDVNDNMEYIVIENTIKNLNHLKFIYEHAKGDDKNRILTTAKRILPESFLQKRTINTNYAELRNIYFQRRNHRLSEWHEICQWIESLPYGRELICVDTK